jgi:hypothetical protein
MLNNITSICLQVIISPRKMSLNWKIRSNIPFLSALVVPFPIFTILGSISDPMLNSKLYQIGPQQVFPYTYHVYQTFVLRGHIPLEGCC